MKFKLSCYKLNGLPQNDLHGEKFVIIIGLVNILSEIR